MKRILAPFLVIFLALGLLAGCNQDEKDDFDSEAIRASIIDEFISISDVPRESTQAKAISTYLRTWAKENGFKVLRDKAYNIIIEKEATPGYEDGPTTILHSNMDMISIAEEGIIYDPFNDTIKIQQDEENLWAQGTNLGADSGIGLSTALYILKNAENHGPLRIIFTANGETTISGAKGIDPKYLAGDYLINLNLEDNGTIGLGSPGYYTYEMSRPINWQKPKNTTPFLIHLEGLKGGSPFLRENQEHANAIKVLGETLARIKGEGILFELASFNGGTMEDGIPAEATALIIINDSDLKKFTKFFKNEVSAFASDYNHVEQDYSFTCTEAAMPDKVLSPEDESAIISFVYGIVNGVQSSSKESGGKAESTTNLGLIDTLGNSFFSKAEIESVSPEKAEEIFYAHEEISRICGIESTFTENMPAWYMSKDSSFVTDISKLYETLLSKDASMQILDTSQEYGWFLKKNPELQIISIGPLVHHAGTPEEVLVMDTVVDPVRIILQFLEQNTGKEA